MKPYRLIPVLLLAGLLSGCTIPSGDDLLAAPRPGNAYQSLQTELDKILVSQSYAAPLGGDNRSTVQLVDLDNDGIEEAVSFFKMNGNSNEYTVYVHKKTDDAYICTGTVTGMGTGIQSVDYPALTPDGRRGMVISWQLAGDGLGALTACDFDESGAPRVLLENEYSAMELADLTGDGAKDLLFITSDETGKRVARMFRYVDGKLALAGEAATSQDSVAVTRIFSGRTAQTMNAVFAEQRTTGGVGLQTDIFVYADHMLHNLALDGEDSATRGTYRPVAVEACDINGDGVIEIPRAVLLAGYTEASASDAIFMLDWYAYNLSEAPQLVQTTYHNVSEEWYFTIDSQWHDLITAEKTSENGLSAVHFSQYISEGQKLPVFTIFCATGSLRDYYAARDDLIQLGQTSKAVFFARLDDGAAASAIQIDEQGIRDRFSLLIKAFNNN